MRPPEDGSTPFLAGRPEFRRTRLGIAAAAFLAPFSATHLAGPLTVGRLATIAFAALFAVDMVAVRPSRFRPDLPALMLVAGYVGLCGWALLSAETWGCNCEGKAGGLFELVVVGLLALVALGFEPRLRTPALIAALGGLVLASALALGGVGSINSGTVDLTETGGRLSGTYGNANELGLSAALGIPLALAYIGATAGRATRAVLGAAILILAVTLVLTFSRGGIIAAAVGIVALGLWTSRGSKRRMAAILAAAVVAVALGAGLYSVFKEHRESASFESVSPALRPLGQRDLSGWDARALGPIPAGPSRLRDAGSGIAVRFGRPGEGASFGWGEAASGGEYRLLLRARSASGAGDSLGYALGDRVRGGGVRKRVLIGPGWRNLSLTWHPRLRAPHAAFYGWRASGNATFELVDVRIVARAPGSAPRTIAIPGRLRGSIYAHLTSTAGRSEERYVRSRLDAARLAWRAFRSSPLRGIGWSTFPTYSSEHLEYGRLAAHDQFLLIAAELGLIGLAFLAAMLIAPLLAARRAPPGPDGAAAIAMLCAALAGMVFVEVLASPQLGVPIALAAAVLCAPGAGAQVESSNSRTGAPPPSDATSSKRFPWRRKTVA